jgi:hypothetical protein
MTSRTHAWAGIRLVPLQHESSFSALLRFAWQNVLDPRTMKQLLNGKRLSLYGDSFLKTAWLQQCGLETIANWNLPNIHECQLPEYLTNIGLTFFSRRLKVCPLCFGAGFHSIWHQLILLNYCPLHGCALIHNCEQCDTALGEYRFSKELFEHPYHCAACKSPIAGAETDLDALLNHRNEITSDISFDAIAKWFGSAGDQLFLLQAIAESSLFNTTGDRVGKRSILIDIAHVLHPFPKEFSWPTSASELTLLTWNIRSRIADDTNIMSNRRELARSNANRKMARAVYLVTIRKIQAWLLTLQSRPTLKNAFADFLTSSYLGFDLLDSATIAFVLFCNCFELSPQFFSTGKFRPHGFRFDHCPPFRLYAYSEREPRLAYYAIYFGIYAGLYWQVERARASGKLADLRIDHLDSLLTKFLLESKDRVAGGVIFRTVPNLPLPCTLLATFKEAKESLTSSEGFRAVAGKFG